MLVIPHTLVRFANMLFSSFPNWKVIKIALSTSRAPYDEPTVCTDIIDPIPSYLLC